MRVAKMAIEDAITNDPAIERHGSEAAAKYMAWHWAALSKAVQRAMRRRAS